MTIEDRSYLAGFIDGEGSIGLRIAHSERNPLFTNYVIRLRATQCNEDIIHWIQVVTGVGSVRKMKYGWGMKHQPYEWYTSGSKALKVLHEIYPYLRVKRIQAEIAFEFEKTMIGHGYTLTKEQHSIRQDLRIAMDSANHKPEDFI
jgi:hypothetical protein